MLFANFDLEGKKFKGFNDRNDEEYNQGKGWVRIFDFKMDGRVVYSSLAQGGSQHSSAREYGSPTLLTPIGSLTPQIWKAMVENTKLTIEVHLTRSVVEGKTPHEKAYMKYKFTGAKICSIHNVAPDKDGQPYMEEIKLSFNQVTWSADDDTTGEKTESEDAINVA